MIIVEGPPESTKFSSTLTSEKWCEKKYILLLIDLTRRYWSGHRSSLLMYLLVLEGDYPTEKSKHQNYSKIYAWNPPSNKIPKTKLKR